MPTLSLTIARRRIESPLGSMLALATDAGLASLQFEDDPDGALVAAKAAAHAGRSAGAKAPAILDELERELAAYFAGNARDFRTALRPVGTPFQLRAWDALGRIPFGETRSYSQVARELGAPNAARAVGLANHDNPIAILIPCHRVLAADGTLHGYAGGLHRKAFLLRLEGAGFRGSGEPGLFEPNPGA